MANEAFEESLKMLKSLKPGRAFTEGCRSYVTHTDEHGLSND